MLHCQFCQKNGNGFCVPYKTLHIAMQIGLYHHYLMDSADNAWRIVSEDSFLLKKIQKAFPADCPHLTDCYCHNLWRVPEDARSFQHIAKFIYVTTMVRFIVTAAVYRGFGSLLRLPWQIPLTFRHRAGVRPYTSSYDLAESYVFSKQSLPPFLCDPLQLRKQLLHLHGGTPSP